MIDILYLVHNSRTVQEAHYDNTKEDNDTNL